MMNESIRLGGRAVQGFGVGNGGCAQGDPMCDVTSGYMMGVGQCAQGDPMCDVTTGQVFGVGQGAGSAVMSRAERVAIGALTLGLVGAGAGAAISYMGSGSVQGGTVARGLGLGAVVGGVAGAIWG